MHNEWAVKKQICEIGQRIYRRDFVAGNGGNISVRIGPDRFLCTPTLTSKGFLTPAEIAVVDGKGNQMGGSKPRTSEILLHLEIFHELPEIQAVCHAHPPYATAFAVAGMEVPRAPPAPPNAACAAATNSSAVSARGRSPATRAIPTVTAGGLASRACRVRPGSPSPPRRPLPLRPRLRRRRPWAGPPRRPGAAPRPTSRSGWSN